MPSPGLSPATSIPAALHSNFWAQHNGASDAQESTVIFIACRQALRGKPFDLINRERPEPFPVRFDRCPTLCVIPRERACKEFGLPARIERSEIRECPQTRTAGPGFRCAQPELRRKRRPYTSTLAVSAFSWMNSRRGSTTSPISLVKMSSASSASLTFTCSSERALVSSVVSHNWPGFISPRPL
jgi:hypothetical protein